MGAKLCPSCGELNGLTYRQCQRCKFLFPEFNSTGKASLLPVRAAIAFLWLTGKADAAQLQSAISPLGSVLWLADLDSLAAWKDGLRRAKLYWDAGFHYAITTSANPVLIRHYFKLGAIRTFNDSPERVRLLITPKVMEDMFA